MQQEARQTNSLLHSSFYVLHCLQPPGGGKSLKGNHPD
jgi:hypothetical protein